MPADLSSLLRISGLARELRIGTYEWRPADDQVIWSPEIMEIYGVTRPPGTEAEFAALLHPDDRLRVEADTTGFLASDAAAYSHFFRIRRPDGTERMVLDRGRIQRSLTGQALRILGVNVDVTDEALNYFSVEERLRVAEGRYARLFGAIDEGFCIVELRFDRPDGRADYRVIEANPAFYAKTGFPKSILGSWLREAAPTLEEHWYQTYGEVARTGAPTRFENQSEMLGRWFDVYAFPIHDPADRHVAILFNDITERKRHDAEMRLLVGEISHRSKNMLGVIQSIARQTAASDPDRFCDSFSERIQGLAASQDLLLRNSWRAVSLDELLRSQLEPFAGMIGTRIVIQGEPVRITEAATKALGMAFHELATNAVKYGALSGERGLILVTWSIVADPQTGPHFVLDWVENDGPPVSPPERQGFGTKVTTRMVEASTGGRVTTDYAPTGFRWSLVAAVANLVE